jgi:hypothetical protein
VLSTALELNQFSNYYCTALVPLNFLCCQQQAGSSSSSSKQQQQAAGGGKQTQQKQQAAYTSSSVILIALYLGASAHTYNHSFFRTYAGT